MPTGAILIIELITKYGPSAVGMIKNIVKIVKNPDPSDDDWETLFKSVESLDYDKAISDAEKRASK